MSQLKVTYFSALHLKVTFGAKLDCRKVQTESATGSVTSAKVRTVLTLSVEDIDFDTQACVLRVKGRNVRENQYVKVRYMHFAIISHVHATLVS